MKMKNNTFEEIGHQLNAAETISIFPHILMDGDALGSAAALCHVLRCMGKDAAVLIEDKIPDNLMFLDKGYCTYDTGKYMDCDIALCIDCGELNRFPERNEAFLSGKTKICIDHHPTSGGIGDFNYIDPEASATGEVVFELLEAINAEIDSETANAIFAAITTDSGNFQYSNTTKRTHQIVTKLYDHGLDAYKTSVALYENESFEKINLMSHVLSNAEVFAGGRAIISCVSQELLKQTDARMEDSEGIVSMMRSIKGIDIAALIKENEPDKIKVSLRAKGGDVGKLAVRFGGGGHEKASGCTLYEDLDSAAARIRAAIEESLCRE